MGHAGGVFHEHGVEREDAYSGVYIRSTAYALAGAACTSEPKAVREQRSWSQDTHLPIEELWACGTGIPALLGGARRGKDTRRYRRRIRWVQGEI